ncbi:receptor-like protein 14 isoform X21 [Citrus sinensis]|uniref:receptor-like protein 14 isoform X21 n=1 Tax=Citrus sinensis TaxID=2711 RepID=UPI0022787A05|nr:receptor-like protein 14 isoform X21 [Citrus sinensis]
MESTSFVKFSLISLIWIIVLMNEMHGYKACLQTERTTLLELKSFFISISDREYEGSILTSWVDDGMSSDCCDDWEGVKCNATTRRVMQLSLNGTRMFNFSDYNSYSYGVSLLNMSLFHSFKELQSLDLSDNWLKGLYENKAYDSNGSLKQLKILNLCDNFFDDSILPYLNTLTSLTTLNLYYNCIEGSRIKQGLANLRHMEALFLGGNLNLTSGFLTRLGLANLTNLKTLHLGSCGITTLQGLAKLKSLETLDLSYNYYIHSSLEGLANLTNLQVLDLSLNQNLTTLAHVGLADLPNLKALDLHSCGITTIQGICNLKNLLELDLSSNNFEGHLPQCLNNLTHLKVLDISYNQLSGNFPSVLTNLTSLEYLDLSFIDFQGTFLINSLANHSKLEVLVLSSGNDMLQVKTENWLPTYPLKVLQLSHCHLNVNSSFLLHQHHLKFLDLSHNQLVGNFPTWLLQNNTGLEVLILWNNSFSGILPRLPNAKYDKLRHLDISTNNFSGKLPENLGIVFQKLIYLDVSKNSFEGNIPYSISEMKELITLDLSRNNFSGELPRSIFSSCLSLETLDLSNNNFYGQLFPNFMNLTHLSSLRLNNNHFSGKMADGLLSSTLLDVLDVSNNKLSGDIPHWIGNFSVLWLLLMSENYLQGSIPVQLGNLESLEFIDISENGLSGSMVSLSNLSSVKHIYLHNNAINGLIPIALLRSSTLLTLDLRDNKFFGRIPHQINELSNLHFLLLRGNSLQGRIPNQLCQLRKLGIMDLSHNRLNGPIPSCLGNISFGREAIDDGSFEYEFAMSNRDSASTYYNSTLHLLPPGELHGGLDQPVGVEFVTKYRYEFFIGLNLDDMAGLDLSSNEFSGEIPWEIGHLQHIRALNLSNNLLSGTIPESFSNLKMIESLDLSRNKLSGRIPQLTELNFLSNFNVSYNNLSGPIPDKEQFATFDDSSYKGNSALCGSMIKRKCSSALAPPATPTGGGEDEGDSVIDMVALRWSFGASYVSVILGLLAALWINSYWRRLWFYFIDRCIDTCYYWLFKYVFHR